MSAPKTSDEFLPMPEITHEMLAEYASKLLVDGSGMYLAGSENCENGNEVVDLFTNSLIEAFDRLAENSRLMHAGTLAASEEAEVARNLHSALRTLAAAALCLLPIYEAVERAARERVPDLVLPN